MIRVLLVDDHPVVLRGLEMVLASTSDIECVDVASDVRAALKILERRDVDVCVVDLNLEGADGFELLRELRVRHPDVDSVVYSMHAKREVGARARAAGASGYVEKSAPVHELLDAIRDPKTEQLPEETALALTEREHQVLGLLRAGRSPAQIADELALARSTVSTHIRNLKDKLKVSTVTALVSVAMNSN